MIKIKEYPPVINVSTIVEDKLVGAKSYKTVRKRLKELKVTIHIYDMIKTKEFFDALIPKKDEESITIQSSVKRTKPFKLS